MPTLHWIGKEKVVNHHLDVPFRVLQHGYGFRAGQGAGETPTTSGNKIIHGDNLEALKSLLPEYEGKVKCIYIDPPYNTGNEGWVYNDNVNDPKIKKWLAQVVGKEGEDLSRHDKWLCMMYPRLKLLHKLLAEDGTIFISIDDNEQANLKLVLGEIFGPGNFISTLIWQKRFAPQNDAKHIDTNHEYIQCYAKNKQRILFNLLPRTELMNSRYKNPDNDPRGNWTSDNPLRKEFREYAYYPITTPAGRIVFPPTGTSWRFNKEEVPKLMEENRLWFGKDGKGVPRIKRFLSEVKNGIIPQTILLQEQFGNTQESKKEAIKILGKANFETPKPVRLMQGLLSIATQPDSIILDSFAGSGTTAHAVLNLNNQDGGTRKFILIEMEDYADTITAERVKRVMDGYGEGKNAVPGTGGAFDYYTLGPRLFLEDDQLNEAVGIPEIRAYIWYSETRSAFVEPISDEPHFLGKLDATAYYFVYDPEAATTLDYTFLSTIRQQAGQYVIYADHCLLPADFMARRNIIFKKIPRDITRF
jgi:adenine-specific DNA-methyltransferase